MSKRSLTQRAIIFQSHGDPSQVLSAKTLPDLPPPPPSSLSVRFALSPINPSDINVIQGIYPSQPHVRTSKEVELDEYYIPGNEGLGIVEEVGSSGSEFSEGDWVIMKRSQAGTWASAAILDPKDVIRIPRKPNPSKLTEAHAATLTVNPPTAWGMLTKFIELKEGDWVVQNGANSAVGQAVIQIAKRRGLQTLNFVRNRPNFAELKEQLSSIGATQVFTYDDLSDKATKQKIKEVTAGKEIRLGLNCVGGKETSLMATLLGKDAHLVSYGAMSKQPLSLPTSLFIFKNLTSHGYWQSRWYQDCSPQERDAMFNDILDMIEDGSVRSPLKWRIKTDGFRLVISPRTRNLDID
ncbi:NAD(P)-binding protein [Sistotremastrum niveocremeum HHB9708]|uniref:enoyl-[acyl-carrier-protein] reductase n=1 Tax=Sistotremastrum niveocremeum HHB9708 TaxID=1314777 RepID=A0A164TTI8_9AGAM|nr:NAD(P)-binding protein [Sistotremastrum niveocremeum HHB9708]